MSVAVSKNIGPNNPKKSANIDFSKSLPDSPFSEKLAPRKTIEELKRSDLKATEKSAKESKDFAIQMIIMSVKDQDPFAENSNQGNEMLQTSNLIAQLDAIDLQNKSMKEMVEAIKNPGFSATELQGKEINYKDEIRDFDGKNLVKFNYQLSFDSKFHEKCSVSTTVTIKNSDGKIVFRDKGDTVSKSGNFEYIWQGKDKNGDLMPQGKYTIEVSANGKSLSGSIVPVKVSTSKTAIVKSVEIKNGIADKMVLSNGETITREQLTEVRDALEVIKPDNEASYSMMGHKVNLDLSKIQVKAGEATIYYNLEDIENIENYDDPVIEIRNSKGNYEKTLNEFKDLDLKNLGSIELNQVQLEGLKDGDYTVELSVRNKTDGKRITSIKQYKDIIFGINPLNNEIICSNNKIFPTHNIVSVEANIASQKEELEKFIGKEIFYVNDKIMFDGGVIDIDHVVPSQEPDSGLYESVLRVYNQNDKLVSRQFFTYDAYSITKEDRHYVLDNIVNGLYPNKSYQTLSSKERAEANNEIRKTWKNNPDYLKDEFADLSKGFPVHYNWDGEYKHYNSDGSYEIREIDGSGEAIIGKTYRLEFDNLYYDGKKIVPSKKRDVIISSSILQKVDDEENGSFVFVFENGDRVLEKQIKDAIQNN